MAASRHAERTIEQGNKEGRKQGRGQGRRVAMPMRRVVRGIRRLSRYGTERSSVALSWKLVPTHMQTIDVGTVKGGAGKSRTAENLAGALARAGRRVLLTDFD